jgi:four helix bundle protein
MFASKLAESGGETTETQVWLDFACGCGYLSAECHDELKKSYEVVGKMLVSMMAYPEKFAPSGIN